MIVRQQKSLPVSYLYGVGGLVTVLMIMMVSIRAMMVPTVTATCDERYKQGVRFSWARQSGEALTTGDLQGKLAGRDWGLIENVRMLKLADAPAPVVLEVDLKTRGQAVEEREDARSGMGFIWLPKAVQKAGSGCLSYSIWVPADFDFGSGGVLPGIFADEQILAPAANGDIPTSKPFSVQMRWRPDASLELAVLTQKHGQVWELPLKPSQPVLLERGRWVRIEQEIKMNEPGAANGTLRAWVDGALGLELGDIDFRKLAEQTMTGVNVDIHFVDHRMQWAPAAKNTRMRLSPLELRIE